jgi:hypothetical protein
VYGGPFIKEGILVHNANNGSFISVNKSANCTNNNISISVVIYALDVNSTIGLKYNMHVVTSDAALSSPVNERR